MQPLVGNTVGALIPCVACAELVDIREAWFTAECGCAHHAECYQKLRCVLHGPMAAVCIPLTTCVVCNGKREEGGDMCGSCHKKIVATAVRVLRKQKEGATIRELYHDVMRQPFWPGICTRHAQMEDINSDGAPSEYTHPYTAFVWHGVAATLATCADIHTDSDGRIWAVGALIEKRVVDLPLRPYSVEELAELDIIQELQMTPHAAINAFVAYLTECQDTQVVRLSGGRVRRRTAHNVTSLADTERALADVAWEGIPISELCKETEKAADYVIELERTGRAVVISDRVYATANIQPVKGFAEKFKPGPD